MTENEIEIFSDSFARCLRNDAFFDIFYNHFIDSSPEVAQKFRHTEFKKQKREVKASLHLAMEAIVRTQKDFSELSEVANLHSSDALDIPPRLYLLWLESLIHAVKECDPQCDEVVEWIWRDAMQRVIDYMLSKH